MGQGQDKKQRMAANNRKFRQTHPDYHRQWRAAHPGYDAANLRKRRTPEVWEKENEMFRQQYITVEAGKVLNVAKRASEMIADIQSETKGKIVLCLTVYEETSEPGKKIVWERKVEDVERPFPLQAQPPIDGGELK